MVGVGTAKLVVDLEKTIATGCIGVVLGLRDKDFLVAADPHDCGSYLEDGVRKVPNCRPRRDGPALAVAGQRGGKAWQGNYGRPGRLWAASKQRQRGAHTIELISSFYRSGSLVFGGGHVVLPLLQQAVVPRGWISNDYPGYLVTGHFCQIARTFNVSHCTPRLRPDSSRRIKNARCRFSPSINGFILSTGRNFRR